MIFERRPALLSIAAVLLLILGGCSSGGTIPGMPDFQAQPVGIHAGKATCKPDFTFGLSPTSASIASGQSVRISADLASLCGLAGTINVGIRKISPAPNGNGFSINQPRYDIPLGANGAATASITLGATPATLKTTYTVTIRGEDISGGCCYGLKHSAIFTLSVK